MSRKVLCPHCGATSHQTLTSAKCSACGKRLPFTLPRNLTYAARTFWKPALALIALALLVWGVPQFQQYRASHHQFVYGKL